MGRSYGLLWETKSSDLYLMLKSRTLTWSGRLTLTRSSLGTLTEFPIDADGGSNAELDPYNLTNSADIGPKIRFYLRQYCAAECVP